jgi:O-antigen/teichoic acid export membrane protein
MNPLLQFLKNVFALLLTRGGDIIYTFLSLAILARYFGPSLYGDYIFIVSFIFIFIPLINFGIHPIMVRELAVNPESGSEYFGSGLAFRLLLAAIALIIILICLPNLGLNRLQQLALLICFLSELGLLLVRIFAEVYIAFEHMVIETYLYTINRGLTLILLLGISYFDLGFLSVFITIGVLALVTLLASIIIVNNYFLRPNLVWRADLFWFWLKSAWPLAINGGIMEYFFRVDIYVLRIFRDPAEIAYFEAPYKIIAKINLIAAAIAIALAPAMSRLAQNGLSQFKPILEQILKILLIIAIPLSVGAIFLGPHLMVPFLGEKFAPAAAAMSLLSWCVFFASFEPLKTATLVAINKVWAVLVVNLVALGVDLALDLYLVPDYGYLGACYANICAYACMFTVSLVLTYYFVGGFSLRRIADRVIPSALLFGIALYFLNYLSSWNLLPPLAFKMVAFSLSLILYAAVLVWSRAITKDDMALLMQAMGKGKTN